MKQVKTKILISLLIASFLSMGFLGYYFGARAGYVADESEPWLTQPLQEASYIIGEYNTTHYYARNQTGYGTAANLGYEMLGTNASSIGNNAYGNLTSGGSVYWKASIYQIDVSLTPSNDTVTFTDGYGTRFNATAEIYVFDLQYRENIRLTGGRITGLGSGTGGQAGFRTTGCVNIEIDKWYIEDIGTPESVGSTSYGINIENTNHSDIHHNYLDDIGGSGIMVIGFGATGICYDVNVDYNYIEDAEAGFALDYNTVDCSASNNHVYSCVYGTLMENHATYLAPHGISLLNNKYDNVTENAIQVGISTNTHKTHDVQIIGGSIRTVPTLKSGIILAKGSYDVLIRDVTFTGVVSQCILAGDLTDEASNVTIQGCHFIGGYRGIRLYPANYSHVQLNHFYGNTIGIDLDGNSDSNFLTNNYIHSATTGINIVSATCNDTVIKYNDLRTCTTKISDTGTDTVIAYNDGFVTENSGSTASCCYNGTWIPHGLAGDPTSITLSLRGNTAYNATWILRVPTVLQSNSTHFQIEFNAWETVGWTQVALTVVEAQTVYWKVAYKP